MSTFKTMLLFTVASLAIVLFTQAVARQTSSAYLNAVERMLEDAR